MFIDASALTALMTDESDARELLSRMQRARRRLTSPLAIWEAAVAVARILDLEVRAAAQAVADYIELMEIEAVAVPPQAAATALDAFDRFGKGRHPAQLNFGDCFAYACARHYDQPLMFK
jgi:ribonuclease VapC